MRAVFGVEYLDLLMSNRKDGAKCTERYQDRLIASLR